MHNVIWRIILPKFRTEIYIEFKNVVIPLKMEELGNTLFALAKIKNDQFKVIIYNFTLVH